MPFVTSQISTRFQCEQPRGTGDLTNQPTRNIPRDHQFHIQSFQYPCCYIPQFVAQFNSKCCMQKQPRVWKCNTSISLLLCYLEVDINASATLLQREPPVTPHEFATPGSNDGKCMLKCFFRIYNLVKYFFTWFAKLFYLGCL